MTSPARTVWDQLTLDPRLAQNAPMRASDRDRDVALRALGEAFADGRLDRDELDERSARVTASRHLGALVAPLEDLAVEPVPQRDAVPAAPPERRGLRDGWVLLVPALVCWAVWVFTCVGPNGFEPYFPWPVFVSLGLLAKLAGPGTCGHPGRRHGPSGQVRGRLGRPGW